MCANYTKLHKAYHEFLYTVLNNPLSFTTEYLEILPSSALEWP
jgi:hypothetical protein